MAIRLAIANDHAGVYLKQHLIEYLNAKSINFKDFGVNSGESVDYPIYAKLVCESIISGESNMGLLICGTGIGMSIAANKFPGIRCALVNDHYTSKMAREHNNANVIALGERVIGQGVAVDALDCFLNTNFLDQHANHSRRVEMINSYLPNSN